MPLRVPVAASALALVLTLSGAPVLAQGRPAAQGKAAGSAQQPADPPAQQNDPKTQVLKEVVVTGLRQSVMSAEAIKRLAPQIVDAVSAEDIGALPDRSVAEALQRIPGVMIERTDNNRDPARLTDSGGNVFIRGLSWVKSELDGEDIFGANNGEQISFEDISPDLLSGIKVYKSPTADQIEGGIGGVVDMETRKPLNSRRNLTAFSADYSYGDMIKKAYPTVNGLWSNYWNTGIGRVGVLLSGTYAKEGNRTDSIQLGDYVAQTLPVAEGNLPAGSTVYVPDGMGWRRLDWQQNRQDLDGVFQWQSPEDDWLFTAHAFQTKDNPQNLEFAEGDYGAFVNSPSGALAPTPTPTAACDPHCTTADYTAFTSAGVVTAGTVGITPQFDTRYEKDHHSTDDFSASLAWTPNDRVIVSNDVQFLKSHADMVSMTAYTQVGDQSGNPFYSSLACPSCGSYLTFNLAGNNPTMVLSQNPYEMNNPAAYWWAAAMDHIEDNDAHQWADRLDGTFKLEHNDWLSDFRVGARFQDRRAITRESGWNWSLLSHQYWGGGPPYPITQSPGYASEFQPYGNFMRGSVPFPGVGYFPSYQLVRNGTAYAYSILQGTETAGWGWTPLTTDWSKYTPVTGDNPSNGVNDQAQHTYAVYGELDFKHDHTPIGRMDGNIGLRVVRTVDAPAQGILAINSITNAMNPAACIAKYGQQPCQFLINAETFTSGATNIPFTFPANTYTNVLPSFNVRFLLTHDLQWRLAVSKGMTRPSFDQMVPFQSVGFSFGGNGVSPAAANPESGTSGNPELKPIESTNFDSSLEWYFAPAGDLTFDIFYKKIKNYIFSGVHTETLTRNGVSESFQVMQNMNGPSGSVKGFELAYQQFYGFLPGALSGLGLQGNLTFVDATGGSNSAINVFDACEVSSNTGAIAGQANAANCKGIGGAQDQTLPLEGMSRWTYNAALMYQKYGFEGRLAWNWTERYLLTTSAANLNEPVWMDNYGQLDGELFYNVTDYLKVGLQATNLLEARTKMDVGGATFAPVYSWTDTDRTVALAVRLQF
jgi:TonB-dependent receptor